MPREVADVPGKRPGERVAVCGKPPVRDSDERAARRRGLGTNNEDMERVRALREERKRLRKEKSFGRKTLKAAGGPPAAVCDAGAAGPSSSSTSMAPEEEEDGDIVDNDDSL